MKTAFLNHMCFVFLALFAVQGYGQDSAVRIPLKTLTKPALDLVDQNGQALSLGQLKARFDQNVDLSTINPAENKFWQNTDLKTNTATDPMLHAQMPPPVLLGVSNMIGKPGSTYQSDAGVVFDGFVGVVRELGLYAINVKSAARPSEVYRLKSGLQVHASLLKAALLRKMGVFQESPKYYQSIKVQFKDVAEMDSFIRQAFCVAGPDEIAISCLSVDPESRGFISDRNEQQKTLILHGSYLEKMNPEVPSLFDGLTPSNDNTISLYAQSRAYRALIVPYVIGDVAESVNRYSAQSVSVRGGWGYLNFAFFSDFNGYTSYDDVRWALRIMAQFTDADWQQIIDAASYPAQVAPLVKAKMLHRFNNMMETFFSRSEKADLMKVQLPDLNYSSGDGVVVNGKVMSQTIAGYPQRFSHGERQSPFESGDFAKYMKIKAQSTAIDTALARFSDKLQHTGVNQNITGLEQTGNGYRPIVTADIFQAGLNASANRIVTTGTYYGSDAAVQMVDSLTLAGHAGYYHVLDGMNNLTTIMGGGVSLIRSFVHVRPIASMSEATRVPVGKLLVPTELGKLTRPLKDGKLTEFLQALKPGEVFTITDSIGLNAQLGISTTIDALTAFSGVGLSVGFSADGSKVILRQIQFIRTNEGLQVYVRNQNNKAFGLEFNVNYFINLLKIRSETTWRDIHTKVYVINYNSSLVSQVDNLDIVPDEQLQAKVDAMKAFGSRAALALRGLLRESSTDALDEGLKFQQFNVDHTIKTNEFTFKFLWFRSTKLTEEHLLTLQKTQVPTMVNGISVANEPVQVVTYKKGRLKGKDPFGFGTEIADAALAQILGSNAPRSLGQPSQNPSQMPFGQSHWTIVRSDTELTQNRQGALPSVAVIENVWGGWSMNRKQMNDIIAKVKDKTNGINFADYPLVPTGALATVNKIDFYRVTAHMSVLPDGLKKIREFMLSPKLADSPDSYAQFMDHLVEQFSDKYAPQNGKQDTELFSNLIKMMGNGDEAVGRQLYNKECNDRRLIELNRWNQYASSVRLQGTNYACLSAWVEKLVKLSREFPVRDLRAQNRWMTEVLYVLDEHIPQAALMNYLGQENFLFYLEVTGFRSGDEDGDDGVYVSNVYGEPAKAHPYANGLISVFADKSKINVTELEQASGSF